MIFQTKLFSFEEVVVNNYEIVIRDSHRPRQ